MRIRLRLLLPLLILVLLGGGFFLTAGAVGDAVRDALLTVPGLTRDRAVQSAVHAVVMTGLLVTAIGLVLSFIAARMIVRPLTRMPRTAEQLTEPVGESPPGTVVAEVQDVARGIGRAAVELRDRHSRELRERSELASLIEAVSEGIIQVGPDGRIVRVNQAARILLGLPDDAVGRRVASQVRNADLRDLIDQGVGGEAPDPAEVVVDELRLFVSAAPQPGGGAVATFTDLTDLRRLEEVRRDFVANASHELKTPLTSIRGYAETLRSGDLPDPERKQFLDTISRNAERLQRIVDDLLDLSRLESGRWQPELQTLQVGQTARSCWTAFAERAREQEVAFHTDTDDDLALADPRAMEQIFSNLFDNALRYTPEYGRITVAAAPDEDGPPANGHRRSTAPTASVQPAAAFPVAPGDTAPARWLRVEVRDTGAGIPRDALPRIFERFYRVDPARSRAEGGTGLGLSIVKHMVESMGGAIHATSTLGKGTTMRLWLRRPED